MAGGLIRLLSGAAWGMLELARWRAAMANSRIAEPVMTDPLASRPLAICET